MTNTIPRYLAPAVRVQLCRETPAAQRARPRIETPSDAWAAIRDVLAPLAQERFVTLNLDAKCRLISVTNVSEGAMSFCTVDPRIIYTAGLLSGARSLVLAHNHPSGDSTPSWDDLNLTGKVVQGGKVLGLPVTDHIVVGDGEFMSIREERPDLF